MKVPTKTLLRPLLSWKSLKSFSLVNHYLHHGEHQHHLSTSTGNNNKNDDKEWNDAWETAWLPDDNNSGAPWDSNESKLSADDDIDNLLHSCSDIFESPGNDPKVPTSSEFKIKPDGWETTSKSDHANVWEMSQREEDVLLQEFERRLAFCKFQIASFIKTHIFSRRRPIDGWKYMIEVIGPNARKGKGSVSRIPGLADPATQPFTEEKAPVSGGRLPSRKTR
ncbi:hypothetical protein RDABS01_003210 [Bienertia sinuspersici]